MTFEQKLAREALTNPHSFQLNHPDLAFMLRTKPMDINKIVVIAAIGLVLLAMAVCAWTGKVF